MKYPNFYENQAEAGMRLRGTIVLYDGEPHYVYDITNHRSDGVFRVYMRALPFDHNKTVPNFDHYAHGSNEQGKYIDGVIDKSETCIIRKQMDSPLFNRFRPFPLGMCNVGDKVFYYERQPLRPKTEQGLTKSSIVEAMVSMGPTPRGQRISIDMFSSPFADCIRGDYPTFDEALRVVTSDEYDNSAVAFDRRFALLRGPIGLTFLSYKADTIGLLPDSDAKVLKFDKKNIHLREAIEALGVFERFVE